MRLYDPGTLIAFLGRHGLSATKGLGQHFLISKKVVETITGAVADCPGILEIGPGPGVLTQPLSEASDRTIALELDLRMAALLRESAPQAEVRHVDALKANLGAILDELPTPRAIVSNMPYYITGALLQVVADQRCLIDKAVLMMQREVALRVIAPAGDSERGSLSVYLQSLFSIRSLIEAPARLFLPPPKVDSMVLIFTPRTPDEADLGDYYFRIVRFGFSQPRKTLANNLAHSLHLERDEIVSKLEDMGLWEKTRAQELTLENWKDLSSKLSAIR